MIEHDRDILIRVEEGLQNTNQNQLKLLEDLKTIFNRLEQESKIITVISGDLKAHLESSVIRWNNLNKDFSEINRRFSSLEDRYDAIATSIIIEREERISLINKEREERKKGCQESENFEREVRTSVRTIGWFLGILSSIATVISIVSIFSK